MKVLNKYRDNCALWSNGINIMRGSRWGNPFIVGVDGTREEVVRLFEEYAFWRIRVQPKWLEPLKDKDIVCCCAPAPCHGDVIVDILKIRKGCHEFR